MADGQISGRKYGINEASAANFAHQRALDEAIILASLTGAIHPSRDEAYLNRVSEQIIDRITAFAVHARRSVEISDTRDISVNDARWKVTSSNLGSTLETRFWTIVNRILHAREIQVVTFEHGSNVFQNLGDRIITHVQVKSDQGGLIHFCPFAFVYAYLDQIAPTIAAASSP